MDYQSTRNKNLKETSSFAIMTGIAPDGGLFVPTKIPKVSLSDIASLSQKSYQSLASSILSLYLTDYSYDEIEQCTSAAYTKEKFETASIAPVFKLDERTYILELWHGPTCAFKDMALQILPHLLTKAIEKNSGGKNVLILVATSGDTGKAALEGFKNVRGTKIQVFYPVDGVSKIQKLQMTTQDGSNVGVVAVKGNFDDAQTGVKQIFSNSKYQEKALNAGYMFSSANSINWGRLAPQIVYYFASYADLLRNQEITSGEKINIVVPTGNFGNILAAYYAKLMGLPINKLICASNINNVLTDFIKTGVYDRNRQFETTISPSMDILISSNLERFLFHASEGDDEFVKKCMQNLLETGKYEVDQRIKKELENTFYAGFCSDEDTLSTIKNTFENHSYVIDTHTAVGKFVYDNYVKDTNDLTKTIIASTANPFKFASSVLNAISADDSATFEDEFLILEKLSQITDMEIPSSLLELKTKFVRFGSCCEKDEMWEQVEAFL